MTSGAEDLVNLWNFPDDAYRALQALNPEHELVKLYEQEWVVEGPKPKLEEKFDGEDVTLVTFVARFTDAMWAAAKASGR